MSISIRVHFDGKMIVPDEPVDLPVGQPLRADFEVLPSAEDRQTAREAWEAFVSRPIPGPDISDESLRRENIYEDRNS